MTDPTNIHIEIDDPTDWRTLSLETSDGTPILCKGFTIHGDDPGRPPRIDLQGVRTTADLVAQSPAPLQVYLDEVVDILTSEQYSARDLQEWIARYHDYIEGRTTLEEGSPLHQLGRQQTSEPDHHD